MGLFSNPSDKYSQTEKSLSTVQIKQLVSRVKVNTLDQGEESLVEQELIARKGSNGTISMRQIYDVLNRLENSNNISAFDKKKLLQIFEEALT